MLQVSGLTYSDPETQSGPGVVSEECFASADDEQDNLWKANDPQELVLSANAVPLVLKSDKTSVSL